MEEKIKCCTTCNCCIYIGEDNCLCDKHQVLVMEDFTPTDNFNYCNECDWEED